MRLAFRLIRLLPMWSIPGLCWMLGWIWWTVLPIRRRTAVDNVHHAFPGVPPGPFLRQSLSELVLGVVEWLRGDPVEIEWEGLEALQEACRSGGVILLSGHCPGFEITFSHAPRLLGVPISMFTRLPSAAAVREEVVRVREESGLVLLPPDRSMGQGLQILADGGLVCVVNDQRRNKGIPVPFFGRPAWTSPGLAVLHQRSGAPVFAGWTERLGPYRIRATLEPFPMTGDVEADTAATAAWIEARIRRAPEGWLWLHDRWRVP